jgi:hypothetical protein
MQRTIRAARLINRALDLFEVGGADEESLGLTERALGLLERDRESPLNRVHKGRAHQLRAEIFLRNSGVDLAIEEYAKAESEFKQDGQDQEHYVRCVHDAAITFKNLGLDDVARHYAVLAETHSAGVGGRYESDSKRLALIASEVDATSYKERVSELAEMVSKTDDLREGRSLFHQMASLLLEFGDDDEVDDALNMLASMVEDVSDIGQRVAILAPIGYLARRIRPLPEAILTASISLLHDLPESADLVLKGEAHLVRAVAKWSTGDIAGALDQALMAVALYECHTWNIGSSVVRLMTGNESSTARSIALDLASISSDARLVAELIETARFPALPDFETDTVASSYVRNDGEITNVAMRRMQPVHPIEVDYRSRLAPFYPSNLPLAQPLNLDAAIERVGGKKAWWWGAWLGPEGRRYWAVRDDEGFYHCGSEGHGFDDDEWTLILSAMRMTPSLGSSADAQVGSFNESPAREEKLSIRLGKAVIPEIVRNAAQASTVNPGIDRRTPPSLVVSGNYLSMLPLPLLGVATTPTGRSIRLLEAFVIRVAPPITILDQIRANDPPEDLPVPLAVVCMDPKDNLANATLPTTGTRVLAGVETCLNIPGSMPATKLNLTQALKSIPDGRGVFAYSGHAGAGPSGGDLESAFMLADEPLSADALFRRVGGRPVVPFPNRVLLAACGSAGSSGSGSGEWLGLTAGALCSGAQQVLATAWPIWDTEFTRRFDAEILSVLCTQRDAAIGLRDVQLRCLDSWRETSSGSVDSSGVALPLVWCAYQHVGIGYYETK